jgi:hypothetical protein
MKTFTQKELAHRWQVNIRTVQRTLRKYGNPKPVALTGIQPIFDLATVKRLEKKRTAAMVKSLAFCRLAKLQAIKKAGAK